ncbi:aldehyde dehydrogenase family protein [Amycolatopsis sp. NPDC051372]|uniref:aldehyde dehydrogenase family protein n=1 Tax=unclassified Amycolatopsis TaxID=2618356 RepID=UPI00344006C4
MVLRANRVLTETGGSYVELTVLHDGRLADDTDYGPVASAWTRDVTTAHRVAKQLRAGTVWVNTFDASDVITPFGGSKRPTRGATSRCTRSMRTQR